MINIGTRRKVVREAIYGLMDILNAHVDERTKRAAIALLQKAVTVSNVTIKDCNFTAEPVVEYRKFDKTHKGVVDLNGNVS